MTNLEPPYREIWYGLSHGLSVAFLGAGASLAHQAPGEWDEDEQATLPSGAELSRYLAMLANYPEEDRDQLAKVADYYRLVVGDGRLRERLHDIFDHDYAYGPLHELLASIPTPQLFVSTNYDDLLERALQAAGRPFDLVIHPTERDEWAASVLHWPHSATAPKFVPPKRLEIDLARRTVIYKMHGAVDRHLAIHDSYVISERHFIDFMVRMANQTAIPAIFAEPFQTRSFLFLGYSLRDWNLRVLLAKIAHDLRRSGGDVPQSWAIQRHPSPLEQELWRRNNVHLYALPLSTFVDNLAHASRGRDPVAR